MIEYQSAFSGAVTPPLPECRVAGPMPYPNGPSPQTSLPGWPSQSQRKSLAKGLKALSTEEIERVKKSIAVLAEVVADYCIANFPRGSKVAVSDAIAMLCSTTQKQAITVH